MKKVYFAGSIRGGRADAELYRQMIAHIKREHEVLTEHVGDTSLSTLEGEADRDAAIYTQDTGWIGECDILIAECTCPSLGVGYELAFAEKLGKPCFVFYNKTRCSLSAMIKGDTYFKLFPYENGEDVFPMLDEILGADTIP